MDAVTPTNESDTGQQCPMQGNTWWIFLAVTATIYIICLGSCSAAYGLYWLWKRKRDDHDSPTRFTRFATSFQDCMRQVKSGDNLSAKIYICVIFMFNLIYFGLTIRRSIPIFKVEECITIAHAEVIVEVTSVCTLFSYSVVRFLAAKNIALYWIDIYTIVDVCTLPLIVISLILGVDWIGLRSLRFIWVTQFTTVLQFTPLLRSQNVVDVVDLLMYFLVLWLTSSGILHLIESQGDFWRSGVTANPHSVLQYVYLTMVTISTVGYGDISPVSDTGKGFMILFIISGLAMFAAFLPKIVEITAGYYARSQYASFDTTRVPKHVIVCGYVTAISAQDFLKDFLHPDRGDTQTHVLFLHSERPDSELKDVLRTYYTRVQFLLGSVLNANTLHKARILNSSAIFILADKSAENPTEEDHANLLRVVSVKNTTDKIPVIIQLLHSFSKKQVENIEGWWLGRDIALCLNEMKLGLLAQSCLCPGFATLVANLFYTSDFPAFSSFSGDDAWKELYFKGASNEIYPSTFSHIFSGMTFHEAARICFNKLNLVLLALEHIESNCRSYYVNPSLKYHPKLRIIPSAMVGYFIAQDKSHVSSVNVYCECCTGNKHMVQMKDDSEIKLQLQRKKSRSLRRKQSVPPDSMSLSEMADNGDMVIHFYSSTTTTPKPWRASEVEVNGSVLKPNGTGLPVTFSELNLDTASSLQASDELSCDNGSDSLSLKSHLYVCRPSKLEDKILNIDILSVDFKPKSKPNIQNHIVLCLFADVNSPLLGLESFLKPLRSKHLPESSIKPVVIVCDRAFIEKEWQVIRNIPELYVVEGSPLLWANLFAANVMECSVCVVLTLLKSSIGEPAIIDKEAILCSLGILKKLKRFNKKVVVITDLRQESNVQFLDFGDEDKPDERIYKAQPFACGEAFSTSMFDSITSSVFRGPGTLYLVEDLIHSSRTKTPCQVVSLPISDTNCAGTSYGEFYNAQLNESTLCLGLSRKLTPFSRQSYVITAPDSDLVLEETDVAFLLTE